MGKKCTLNLIQSLYLYLNYSPLLLYLSLQNRCSVVGTSSQICLNLIGLYVEMGKCGNIPPISSGVLVLYYSRNVLYFLFVWNHNSIPVCQIELIFGRIVYIDWQMKHINTIHPRIAELWSFVSWKFTSVGGGYDFSYNLLAYIVQWSLYVYWFSNSAYLT